MLKVIINFLLFLLRITKNDVFDQLKSIQLDSYNAKLDLLESIPAITRMTMLEAPKQESKWRFKYDPTYAISGDFIIYNYIETDESLRKRIKELMK